MSRDAGMPGAQGNNSVAELERDELLAGLENGFRAIALTNRAKPGHANDPARGPGGGPSLLRGRGRSGRTDDRVPSGAAYVAWAGDACAEGFAVAAAALPPDPAALLAA